MKKIVSSGRLERKLDLFNEKQRKKIFSKILAIQLTEGCSTGCTDCGVNALRNVRDYIPYGVLSDISSQYGTQLKGGNLLLYFASEPFDYDFNGKNYVDVHSSFQENTGENPCVITSIPKGKEELIFSYIFGDNKINEKNFIWAISLTKFNYKRVEQKMMELPYFKNQIKSADGFKVKLPCGEELFSKKGEVELNDLMNDEGKLNNCEIRDYINSERRSRIDFDSEKTSVKHVGGISSNEGFLITPQEIYYKKNHKPSKKFPFGFSLNEITPENISSIYFKLKMFDLVKNIKLI
ncbi:MAG: hypothetical protein ABFQ65_04015 [Nanoarchaeota archaeon]